MMHDNAGDGFYEAWDRFVLAIAESLYLPAITEWLNDRLVAVLNLMPRPLE